MKTDRELLELAAKAIGFGAPGSGATCWTESEYPRKSGSKGALWNYVGFGKDAELWNPLTDDGDALRLAVALGIGRVICLSIGREKTGCEFIFEQHGADPYAATRRAIVRAAAEIGEAMP